MDYRHSVLITDSSLQIDTYATLCHYSFIRQRLLWYRRVALLKWSVGKVPSWTQQGLLTPKTQGAEL